MLLRLMAPGTESLGFGSEAATSLVEADGRFTFLSVPSGVYALLASPAVPELGRGGGLPKAVGFGPARGLSALYPTAPDLSVMWWQAEAGASVWGRVSVSVGDSDVTNVELPLRTAAAVRGRVVFDNRAQPDPRELFLVSLEPADGNPSLGAPNATTTPGDVSHAFTMTGLQGGRYLVRFRSFRQVYGNDWCVESITADGVNVTDTGLDGALGHDYDNVVVTVSKTGAALSGRVLNPGGRPATGPVVLFPADSKEWVDFGLTPPRLRSTDTSADGAYGFSELPSGDYNVIAVSASQADEWLDPKFLAAAARHPKAVSLGRGETQNQDLPVSEVVVK